MHKTVAADQHGDVTVEQRVDHDPSALRYEDRYYQHHRGGLVPIGMLPNTATIRLTIRRSDGYAGRAAIFEQHQLVINATQDRTRADGPLTGVKAVGTSAAVWFSLKAALIHTDRSIARALTLPGIASSTMRS